MIALMYGGVRGLVGGCGMESFTATEKGGLKSSAS